MQPAPAIEFANNGESARINYAVPLPGSHTGHRVVEVDLGLQTSDFLESSMDAGRSLSDLLELVEDKIPSLNLDPKETARILKAAGLGYHPGTLKRSIAVTDGSPQPNNDPGPEPSDTFIAVDNFVLMPTLNWAGVQGEIAVPIDSDPEPRIALIERYGISSFLGDYGMGRTVRTYTLLPGESTQISLKTWQSTTESRKASSSIIDSHEEAARERFADTVQKETTDKQTKAKTEAWHAEAEVSASWGFGDAKVSGGGSGEYSSGREQFARQLGESVKEHAAESSSKRELSVTSSTESTEETGNESLIERTIKNVNVRRALNFVFRELNQVYSTKVHLKEVRVAFTNNKTGSLEVVPISGLLPFLKKYIRPEKVDETAQRILKAIGIVFDANDAPAFTLEAITISDDGTQATITEATVESDGQFPAPRENMYYRFKRGSLNQADASNPVDGVLLSSNEITLRTDSVLVEALLGQADALDEYAMEIQKANASEKSLQNSISQAIIDTAYAITDPVERAKALAEMLKHRGLENQAPVE